MLKLTEYTEGLRKDVRYLRIYTAQLHRINILNKGKLKKMAVKLKEKDTCIKEQEIRDN